MVFQDFDLSDKDVYLDYLRRCIQMPSDSSPYTLCAYSKDQKLQRAFAYDLFWFRGEVGGKSVWLPPIGDWDAADWKTAFSEIAPDTNFVFIPELLAYKWKSTFGDAVEVEATRDDWDYIWYSDQVSTMLGPQYKSYRSSYNRFEKNYPYTVEELTPAVFDELRAFHEKCEQELQAKTDKLEDVLEESDAFYFWLNNWDPNNLFGFIVRVDGHIVGVRIDEIIDENNTVALYQKQDHSYKGITEFIYITDSRLQKEKGFLIVNMMSDAGSVGLRSHKEASNPLVLMKKYHVCYKGEPQHA